MDKNLVNSRSYYYEFLAFGLFFYESDTEFKRWKNQLEFLSKSPISTSSKAAFDELFKISFDEFKDEQNELFFSFSYTNIPLSASFYDEGRDDGLARIDMCEILRKTPFRKDEKIKDSEDYIGFIFMAMSFLLQKGEFEATREIFCLVINKFIDEFCFMLDSGEKSGFYSNLSVILADFIALERSLFAIKAPPKKESSVAVESLKKKPFVSRMPTPKSKIFMDEMDKI